MTAIKDSKGDQVFVIIIYIILFLILIAVAYPSIYVISASVSSPRAVISGQVWLWPVEPMFKGYAAVFRDNSIITGYLNSLFYTTFGTLINIVFTVMAAYPLSRKVFMPRNFIMALFVFTMLFSGGLIPTYMVVNSLHMVNTRWAMLIPGAMSVWNVILTRTFFTNSIPEGIYESAVIDGCNEFKYIFRLLIPLSKPILAVITLYYAVGHWNAYFQALIYLRNRELFPLQIILRRILIMNTFDPETTSNLDREFRMEEYREIIKYALIVVASLPVMMLYPLIQKYFVKGIMIGSIKG